MLGPSMATRASHERATRTSTRRRRPRGVARSATRATMAADKNHRSLTRDPGGRAARPGDRAGRSGGQTGGRLAAGALPCLVDPVDEREQFLGLLEVDGPLDLGGLLGGLPARLGDVGVLLEVLG